MTSTDKTVAIGAAMRAQIRNAREADNRFRADFAAWSTQDGDDIPPPDMMTAALELSAHLAAILDQLEGEQS